MTKELTHLDEKGNPQMVDVGDKAVTARVAVASCLVTLPDEVTKALTSDDMHTKKGSVTQTAILAGIMAAKKTPELIPLCHPVPLTDCTVEIELKQKNILHIRATAKTHAQTGVEMEALTAVSIAALTVYDMCKGLSHDILIGPIQLESKTGGKHAFKRS